MRLDRRTRRELGRTTDPTRRQQLEGRLTEIGNARAAVSGAGEIAGMGIGGRLAGGLGLIAAEILKAATAFIELPATTSHLLNGFMGQAEPYRRMKYGMADMGRAGGFNGASAEGLFYHNDGRDGPTGLLSYLGMDPNRAIRLSQAYGVNQNAGDVEASLRSFGRARRSNHLGGMSEERYAGYANLMSHLGIETGGERAGPRNLDRVFQDLQRTMTAATAAGMDKAQVMRSIEGLFQQAASAGSTSIDGSKLQDFFTRMAATGAGNMRTGEGQAAILAGARQAGEGYGAGGDVPLNAMLQSYTQRNGGIPKDAEGLKRFLGWSDDEFKKQTSNGAGKANWDALLRAAQEGNGYFFNTQLGAMVQSNPELNERFIQGSMFGQMPGSSGDLARRNLRRLNTTTNNQVEATGGLLGPTGSGAVTSPKMRALLSTIRDTESGDDYTKLYGGDHFTDLSRHPNQMRLIRFGSNAGRYTSVAGAYQFRKGTWDEAAAATGRWDMSKESQDINAQWLARRDYALRNRGDTLDAALERGDIDRVASSLRETWTSFPGSSTGEGQGRMDGLRRRYGRHLNQETTQRPPVQVDLDPNDPSATPGEMRRAGVRPTPTPTNSTGFMDQQGAAVGNVAMQAGQSGQAQLTAALDGIGGVITKVNGQAIKAAESLDNVATSLGNVATAAMRFFSVPVGPDGQAGQSPFSQGVHSLHNWMTGTRSTQTGPVLP